MSSPYSDVYNKFLNEITDDTLLDFTEAERETILFGYLKKAISRFKACQTDLLDRNETSKQFNNTLTDEEMNILAVAMKKPWLSDKIYKLELLQQRMTTKDFRLSSQAEHLKNLTILKGDLDKDISQAIVQYTTYNVDLGNS